MLAHALIHALVQYELLPSALRSFECSALPSLLYQRDQSYNTLEEECIPKFDLIIIIIIIIMGIYRVLSAAVCLRENCAVLKRVQELISATSLIKTKHKTSETKWKNQVQ